MCVDFRLLVNFHLHFEGIQLFLDLLSKHWGQPVASSDFAPPIILPAWPRIMELDARAETDISS